MGRLLLAFPLLLVALAVAACGGGEDDEDARPLESKLPEGAVELEAGDYGLLETEGTVDVTLTAVAVSCLAPNLMSLETEEDTFFFQISVLTNFECEQAREQLLKPVGSEQARRVGVRYEELADPLENGDHQVTIVWEDSGSTMFPTFKVWRLER